MVKKLLLTIVTYLCLVTTAYATVGYLKFDDEYLKFGDTYITFGISVQPVVTEGYQPAYDSHTEGDLGITSEPTGPVTTDPGGAPF